MPTITRQVVPLSREDVSIGMTIGPEHPTHAGLVVADVFEDSDTSILVFDGSTPDLPVADTEQVPIDLPLNDALNLIGETMGVEGLALMAAVLLGSQEQTQHTMDGLIAYQTSEANHFARAYADLYEDMLQVQRETDSAKLRDALDDIGTYREALRRIKLDK